MRVCKLLHKMLGNQIHSKRITVLGEVLETCLFSKSLSVTMLGRKMNNKAQQRSNVRKVERLYSNPHLLSERDIIYREMNRLLLTNKQPIINIDGSKLLNSTYYTLRATIQLSGRGLTVYEKLFTGKATGSLALYKFFMAGLKSVLPEGVTPILVTDAEFRKPWFDLVRSYGWDFIGRVRGHKNLLLQDETDTYQTRKAILERADATPRALGLAYLNVQEPVEGFCYIYKAQAKGRHAFTRSGRHSETKKSMNYSKSAKEGWLLFSSLNWPAQRIVNAYYYRMTIELSFRDHKSGRYGLGLDMTRSKKVTRYKIMLIIAALAAFVAYILGTIGEMKKIQYQYQVNSSKKQRIISRFFLGCEMFYRGFNIIYEELKQAISFMINEINYNGQIL